MQKVAGAIGEFRRNKIADKTGKPRALPAENARNTEDIPPSC